MKARLEKEAKDLSHLLNQLGFDLEKKQPHINGERFLMAHNKLVLVGRQTDNNLRVVIKISHLAKGKEEIRQEKKVRDILSSLVFVKEAIFFPKEIYFGRHKSYLILITEFIHQEQVFILHPLKKQFSIIIRAFEAQETLYATTFKHKQRKSKTFPVFQAKKYLKNFKEFQDSISRHYHTSGLEEAMKEGWKILKNNESIIEKHCNYLIHTDFVPHNFRIRDDSMYILDCSAFYFGNKHEGLARFLNYMVIHNPALEKLLKEYILKNRNENEYLNLRLMRIYKIGYLLQFYAKSLSKTSYDLHALTISRIEFWEEVLRCVIQDKAMDKKILKIYIKNRNNLRSAEEKNRQKEFAVA